MTRYFIVGISCKVGGTGQLALKCLTIATGGSFPSYKKIIELCGEKFPFNDSFGIVSLSEISSKDYEEFDFN